jgi:hypothetical protein
MTQEQLFIIYYVCMVSGTATGLVRYKVLDNAMRTFVALLCLSCLSELMSYYCYKNELFETRNAIYHGVSAIEMVFYAAYFLKLLKPARQHVWMKIAAMLSILICAANAYFFESLKLVNANILMLQSFLVITMSLYAIYSILKTEVDHSIFQNPHVWICILWLVWWSCTFFFWAFLKILYSLNWIHMELVLRLQIIMLIGIYIGIATVLIFYKETRKNIGYV